MKVQIGQVKVHSSIVLLLYIGEIHFGMYLCTFVPSFSWPGHLPTIGQIPAFWQIPQKWGENAIFGSILGSKWGENAIFDPFFEFFGYFPGVSGCDTIGNSGDG